MCVCVCVCVCMCIVCICMYNVHTYYITLQTIFSLKDQLANETMLM